MKIRRLVLPLALIVLCTSQLSAQDKKLNAKLNHATVFLAGAELTHTVASTLKKGENEITIEGLSPDIDRNSLRIKASNGAVVSAYEFTIDYLSSTQSLTPVVKKLQDSIDICTAQLNKLRVDLTINSDMLQYLKTGVGKNVSGSEKGLGIEELRKTMDYYKTKSEQLETEKIALIKKRDDVNRTIARLRSQMNQETNNINSKTSGNLKLAVSAPMAQSSEFTITYYTQRAGWNPYYDINVVSIDRPIAFKSKAKVYQTTGIDWNRVRLTLSTSIPSNGKIAPLFTAWFLKQKEIAPIMGSGKYMREASVIQNAFSYSEEAIKLDDADSYVDKKVAPSEPIVVINGQIASMAQLQALDQSMIKSTTALKDAAATSIYGSRAGAGAIVVETKSAEDFVNRSDDAVNITYNIDIPYTVSGSGKSQTIDLKSQEAVAEYKYYCAPRLDTETYLLAEIPGWSKLGLVSANANVTYDGTYIGETYIDAQSTHEKLPLTLGTDRRITVKREKQQDYSSTKTLGSDVLQVFTYKMTVKNNQNKPVKMVLKDQYPISTSKNIVVELRKETTPWTVNKEDVGVVTWEEELAAGETKTYIMSYSVKYPKGMNLNL